MPVKQLPDRDQYPARLTLTAVSFVLAACLSSTVAVCEDNLQSVMARMKPDQAVIIDYQEHRYMRMMSAPWTGSGHFYALLPDTMLKEQLHPEKELMAIRGHNLYYFNPANNQKHQTELSDQDSPAAHIAAFKGLMNGDLTSLKTLYDVGFSAKSSGWLITLTPQNTDSETAIKIIMQGRPEQAANKLELLMTDGDRTEFLLGRVHSGADIKLKATQLFDLLSAD
ncbi:MAG: outer membrane lipoprotein carrier protein LolA [Methylococcaceae bacterium]|nr:outer membrane lipoprotein carrier protein LolA [Methylococcaceae bacterium]